MKHQTPRKADTLPRPEDIAPRLAEFLRDHLPEEPHRKTVRARVLLRRSPVSEPIAQPGEF